MMAVSTPLTLAPVTTGGPGTNQYQRKPGGRTRMPGAPDDHDLAVLEAELDIPVTPAQWAADRALQEKTFILAWAKAVKRTPAAKWRSGEGEDAAMGAANDAIDALTKSLGPGAKPGVIKSLSGWVNTTVTFKLRDQDRDEGDNSDTRTAKYQLGRRIREEAPDATASDIRRIGQEVYDEQRAKGRYPANRFWLDWGGTHKPLPFDPTSSSSARDEGGDPVYAAAEEALSRNQSDVSDLAFRDHGPSPLDAYESTKAVVDSWQTTRRDDSARGRAYRLTVPAEEERKVAARLRQVTDMMQKTAALAVWAEKTNGPVSVPKPGILADKDAAGLIKRFGKDQEITACMDDWEHGEGSDLFAPFGDIDEAQKDVIVEFLKNCPPVMRGKVVHDWVSMASASNARIAQAATSVENAQSLVDLVVAQIHTENAKNR